MTEQAGTKPWLLAIDTSTEQAGLAVTDGRQTAEISWFAGRDQTVSALSQIDALLSLVGIESNCIKAVAVATGPGSFSGLRVGMSLAKGFHIGLGASLIGITTLEIAAYPFYLWGRPVAAVVPAGRERLVWDISMGLSEPVNGTADELAAEIREIGAEVTVAGELSDEQAATLRQVPNAVVPSPAIRARRPRALAELGWGRFLTGDFDDPVSLAPVYVHAVAGGERG